MKFENITCSKIPNEKGQVLGLNLSGLNYSPTIQYSSFGQQPFEKAEYNASNQKPLSGTEFAFGWT